MNARAIVQGIILGIAMVAMPSFAQDVGPASCHLTEYESSERPDPAGTPTQITVGLTLIDLSVISDVDQTVTMDTLMSLQWTDRRLAAVAGCRYDFATIWTPGLQLFNSATTESRLPPQILVEEGGKVTSAVRYNASILSPSSIKDFPFDERNISLQLGTIRYGTEQVRIAVAEKWTGRQPIMTVPDWRIGEPTADVSERVLQRVGRTVSVYNFRIPAARLADFFVFKFVFPLCLIVMMSWSVFWINPATFAPQLSLAATSMLTLIAFQFTVNALLPKVGYLTTMDKFVLSSSFLVFLALVEALSTGHLANTGRIEKAQRVDFHSRWIFPATYVLIILATLVW